MPRLTLAALLLFVAGCSGEDAAKAAGTSSAPSAENIAEATHDEVAEMTRGLLEDVSGALSGVTDLDSARKAKPVLKKIAERAGPLRERRIELAGAGASVEDKMKFGQNWMGMMGQITALGDEFQRLETVPGVADELEEVMTEIMSFFESDR